MFFFFGDNRVKAVRFLHCSNNVENYNICLSTGLAGFTINQPEEGDLIYLIVKHHGDTFCGARGLLKDKSDEKPWPDSDRFVSVYTVDWEKCEDFSIKPVWQIDPRLKMLFRGQARNILKLDKGIEIAGWLDKTFSKHQKQQKKSFEPIQNTEPILLPRIEIPPVKNTLLEKIRIKNFRCINERTFEFNSFFNVLIGDNASGKTAVLDSIAIGIGAYFLGIDQAPKNTIAYADIRKNTFTKSREYQLPCEIEISGRVTGYPEVLNWQRSVQKSNGNTLRDKDTTMLVKIASRHQQLVRDNKEINLPVFNYYGTERLWLDKASKNKTIAKTSRLSGYVDSLKSKSDSQTFIEWMKTRTYSEIQKGRKDEALTLIQAVVGCFLHGYQKILFDIEEDSLIMEDIVENGNTRILWNELSDGYRNIIAMAADLGYRCYILNPHLGLHAAENAEGVVLIDEIDLHLHPKWQKTIVDSFKKAFPNLQFITTTHSPFIVQSLKNEELIDLQGKNYDSDYYTKGIEEIAEYEMDVPDPIRSKKYKNMLDAADKYFLILEELDGKEPPKKLREQLLDIEIQFSSDPAYVAFLKSEKRARQK